MPITDMIKHIVVHVDESSQGRDRLSLAASLAQRFGAYLTGISEPGDVILAEDFDATLQARSLDGEWLASTNSMAAFVAHRARAADLVVLGPHEPGLSSLERPEDVILTCGRPVLVVPHSKPYDHIGDNVVVAWNDSREAAVAVEGALPLMAAPNPITIVSVNPHPDSDWEVGGDLVRQFARHGLRARAETVTQDGRSPSSLVRARAATERADLIVMGAYGHSRWREMVLGGMTRDMLADMSVPLLMAH